MLDCLSLLISFCCSLVSSQTNLAAENVALRHQLAVLRRSNKRPRILSRDRIFGVALSRVWRRWREVLSIVRPETVIRWHRRSFKTYWAWKSRPRGPGRPRTPKAIREIISSMASANPTWGAPRIHGELLKLGIQVSQRTVSNLLPKRSKPPSQTWRTFLDNHVTCLVCLDFLTVPTLGFDILYVFLILALEQRRVVSFGVTSHPTAEWTANTFVQAFPWDTAPRYLLRDRDGVYGRRFRQRVKGMGVQEVLIAPRSPWQNPFVERMIGSIRRECLDHHIVIDASHLRRILTDYLAYYHDDRTHLALAKDTPSRRPVQVRPQDTAVLIAEPRLGGIHHRYSWSKAA